MEAPDSLRFLQYREPLLGHIRRIVKSPADAEDVLQDVYLKAHRSVDQLEAEAAQSTWLFRIATRTSIDYLRSRGRKPAAADTQEPDEAEASDEPSPSLQALVEQREMGACIQRYLLDLPGDYRTVVLLHDLEGLTAKEIASVLELSLANVKVRLHRARSRLKAALETGCALSCDGRGVLVCEPKPD